MYFPHLFQGKGGPKRIGNSDIGRFRGGLPLSRIQGHHTLHLQRLCVRLKPVPDFEQFCLLSEIRGAQQCAPRRLPGGQRVGPAH